MTYNECLQQKYLYQPSKEVEGRTYHLVILPDHPELIFKAIDEYKNHNSIAHENYTESETFVLKYIHFNDKVRLMNAHDDFETCF